MLPSSRRRLLHGFSLPPGWGCHKILRCSKPPPATNATDPGHHHPEPPPEDDEAFVELRQRLLSHYSVAGKPQPPKHNDVDNSRPWNLRKRRAAACAAPQDEKSSSPSPSDKAQAEKARRGTSIQLAADEIEQDLARMCNGRSARKPRRRGLKVQRVIDNLNPGECLCRMLEEWYRVPEDRKKR